MSILPPPPFDIAKRDAERIERAKVELQSAIGSMETRAYKAVVKLSEAAGGAGAKWDDILQACGTRWDNSPECNVVEEALNNLFDQGRCYEPTLGVVKPT